MTDLSQLILFTFTHRHCWVLIWKLSSILKLVLTSHFDFICSILNGLLILLLNRLLSWFEDNVLEHSDHSIVNSMGSLTASWLKLWSTLGFIGFSEIRLLLFIRIHRPGLYGSITVDSAKLISYRALHICTQMCIVIGLNSIQMGDVWDLQYDPNLSAQWLLLRYYTDVTVY